ncbi:hypothetical protein DM01DRAFT_1331382 [Hesseltinella vesiculosa]|uniref:Uncharacterized protein n=1 Tax=Hesseltinella vesiculosa TaxID=101127 RepID=A0A1X2GWC1_9FUNG|nr:hypothetical protein DM01DRAFT_1331382 [Hesseltinella vesiculosa]
MNSRRSSNSSCSSNSSSSSVPPSSATSRRLSLVSIAPYPELQTSPIQSQAPHELALPLPTPGWCQELPNWCQEQALDNVACLPENEHVDPFCLDTLSHADLSSLFGYYTNL